MNFFRFMKPRKSKITTATQDKPVTQSTEADGITIKLVAPSASQVCIAGTFNEWKTAPLKCARNGEWIGELKLPPGRHEYLFVVDGEWRPDPAARETVPNPFGGLNSVVCVA
jgi:1,4-alpha-glucan branching enzyme